VARSEIDGRHPDEPARRLANILNTKAELLRGFCGHLIAPGDETVVLYADGRAIEIPVV
jgi:hypothetical protein